MAMFRAWAATQAGGPLQRMDFDPGTLHPEDVEIAVEHCGVCHSDLAMVDSEWFPASYPLVPGHEVVGTIVAVGDQAKGRSVGQRDLYPFSLSPAVMVKLDYVHRLISFHAGRWAPGQNELADLRAVISALAPGVQQAAGLK